jgi:hypothetical protein
MVFISTDSGGVVPVELWDFMVTKTMRTVMGNTFNLRPSRPVCQLVAPNTPNNAGENGLLSPDMTPYGIVWSLPGESAPATASPTLLVDE